MINNSFTLLGVYLFESNFRRAAKISSDKELRPEIQIGTNDSITENKLEVAVVLEYKIFIEDQEVITSKIEMVGAFEFNDENNTIPIDSFAEINAPAIIFPFIREHLATMSVKAGIEAILLPPINFVDLHKNKG